MEQICFDSMCSIYGYYGEFKIYYWIGATIFISMLFYQHSIVNPDDLSRVNIAFMTANGIASVAFSILVITDILSNTTI